MNEFEVVSICSNTKYQWIFLISLNRIDSVVFQGEFIFIPLLELVSCLYDGGIKRLGFIFHLV
jgi:hypothetical protein